MTLARLALLCLLLASTLLMTQATKVQDHKPQTTTQEATPAERQFERLVEEFFDTYFKLNPTFGTVSGFHQYDTQLEDFSRAGVEASIAADKDFLARFDKVDARSLSPERAADLDLLRSALLGELLDLQEIRMWEKDPDRYSSRITNSIFVIMSRSFAPPEERLRSVIARERQIPKVFHAAAANLENPPRVYTDIALEQVPGIISFFQTDVPAAFKAARDPKLLAEFKQTNGTVIAALQRYENFLKQDLLPISKGDYRIGAENYRKKLLYDEMVDTPIDRLLEIGIRNLRDNQQRLKEVAARIDPSKTPEQILDQLQQDHPSAAELLPAFRNVLGGLRQFIEKNHIITVPSPVPPIVEETPPFMRALTFASMDTPGPYEMKAKEAFFNVTLPEKTWTPQKTKEWLEGFNRGTIISTAIHEAYPGHYTQFLWVQQAPSKVRKLIGSNSNSEGWAHYTEQMMLDEGYGNGDLKLRMGQLQDALLRNARYIVGIRMHTGQMSLDEATEFFVREGHQTRAVAEREAKRGTSDPTYLVYTLGKLQILKLRDDYKKMKGDQFTLQEFHDSFMKQGFPPIKIIRKAMLGNDSPVL